jgi:DNA-binding GntR family transcriptional regulator
VPLMAGSLHFCDDEQLRRSLSEHRGIVHSIRLRDAASARAAMTAHLRLALQFMSDKTPI